MFSLASPFSGATGMGEVDRGSEHRTHPGIPNPKKQKTFRTNKSFPGKKNSTDPATGRWSRLFRNYELCVSL